VHGAFVFTPIPTPGLVAERLSSSQKTSAPGAVLLPGATRDAGRRPSRQLNEFVGSRSASPTLARSTRSEPGSAGRQHGMDSADVATLSLFRGGGNLSSAPKCAEEARDLPDLTFTTLLAAGAVLAPWALLDLYRTHPKGFWVTPFLSGLALTVIGFAPAASQSRLESSAALCATLQDAVRQRGGALIYTGPHLYERYVPYCGPRQRDVPASLAARDNPRCFVGYTCAATGN
jgi:hypothetical protein